VRSSVLSGGSDVFVAVTLRMSVTAFTPGAKCHLHWLKRKHQCYTHFWCSYFIERLHAYRRPICFFFPPPLCDYSSLRI